MKRAAAYQKGYKAGYNNPNQFDQTILLKQNSDIAKGAIAGIVDRLKDQKNHNVKFVK